MTRDEQNIQRLLNEAKQAELRLHTRRHFLKESAMGLGALALGSLFGSCGSRSSSTPIAFDPVHPLLPKAPPFFGKAKSVIYMDSGFIKSKALNYLLEVYLFIDSYLKAPLVDSSLSPIGSSPEYHDNSIRACPNVRH